MDRRSALEGDWIVTSYREGETTIPPDERVDATLSIEDDLASGNMGVNRFTGQIKDLPFGPFATTRMAGPEELMLQEDTILSHLHDADTVEVIGDGMTFSRNGLILVELRRLGTGEPAPSS